MFVALFIISTIKVDSQKKKKKKKTIKVATQQFVFMIVDIIHCNCSMLKVISTIDLDKSNDFIQITT